MAASAQGARPAQRLAAAAAVVALVLAVATLGYLLVSRIAVLPFAVAALIVAALTGWNALISRGLRRAAWLAVAVAALAGAIVLLGPSTLVGGAIVVGLVVASTAAARVAIGRHRPVTVPADPGPDLTRVPAAARPVLLINPAAGQGAVQKSGLVRKAVRRNIQCVILREGDDLRVVAEREVADGATAIGIAGGDGSQAVVADVARRRDVPFVCVPAGTRNHFAQDLGIDRRDPVRALDAFGPALERRVDLAMVNGRVFVNNASMGVYAAIVQSDDYRSAKIMTAASLLPELIGPASAPFDLRFHGPDGVHHESSDLLLVSNNPYTVVSPVGVASRPRLDAGQLGVLSLRTRRVPSAEDPDSGRPLAWTATEFEVESAEPVQLGIDGEAVRLDPPLRFATLPGALRVRLAPSVLTPAVGSGPRVLETARALLRIIVNRPATTGA